MNIKVLIISDNEIYFKPIIDYCNNDKKILLQFDNNLNFDNIVKNKFDIILLDSALCNNWIEFHQKIKNYNIGIIFVAIVSDVSVEEVRAGFKDGLYDIIKKDSFLYEGYKVFQRVLETAKILKSTEKINQYCTHSIKFNLPSDVNLVSDTVLEIINTAKLKGFIKDADTENNLRLAYIEAIVNAIIHGNKSDIEKIVIIEVHIDNIKMIVSIEDSGDGYDVTQIPDPIDIENLLKTSGRGIFLIKSVMDQVLFEKNCSKIVLVKNRS